MRPRPWCWAFWQLQTRPKRSRTEIPAVRARLRIRSWITVVNQPSLRLVRQSATLLFRSRSRTYTNLHATAYLHFPPLLFPTAGLVAKLTYRPLQLSIGVKLTVSS